MAEKSVKHIVVDSGGFIGNAPISNVAENVYTLREVVAEIRDKVTRQRLQVLPYEILFRDPPPEAIKYVTDFSKKTGDYPSLSAVDIRVMALVYQLEKEKVGTDHIKSTPERNISWITTKGHLENPTSIAGFYVKKKNAKKVAAGDHNAPVTDDTGDRNAPLTDDAGDHNENITERLEEIQISEEKQQQPTSSTGTGNNPPGGSIEENIQSSAVDRGEQNTTRDVEIDSNEQNTAQDIELNSEHLSHEHTRYLGDGDVIADGDLEEDDEESDDEDEEESDDDDDDDDDGWITPSNIKEVRLAMGDKNVDRAEVAVGCMTGDFAMQNVLIQMGLNVVSVNGMLIKKAKSYVLRCYGCYKISKNIMKEFCFHCGNKTLQKVSMTIEDDGSIRYFLSRKRPISTRGTKFPLPKPQGGKHANNPILCEDQQFAHQRMAKQHKVQYGVMDEDFISNISPFAPTDTNSRAAQLGIHNHKHNFRSKRNPNENNKVYGRRK